MTLAREPEKAGAAGRGPLTLGIIGGPIDGANNGVVALGLASVTGARLAFPDAHVIVQSYRPADQIEVALGDEKVCVEMMPLHYSESLRDRSGTRCLSQLVRVANLLPPPIRRRFVACFGVLEQLIRCDVIMDISGGDSFAEIYGLRRFTQHSAVKRLALQLGKPLVLLPQTYGPFGSASVIDEARNILDRSALIATREVQGQAELRRVFGEGIADRVITTPDVAFLLQPVEVSLRAEAAMIRRNEHERIIGLNVSHTLWANGGSFNLADDYAQMTETLLDSLLEDPLNRVVLVPHVVAMQSIRGADIDVATLNKHSDHAACEELLKRTKGRHGDRIGSVGGSYGPAQMKYLIARCDFFIGARMHACIGAVSQAVPTATLAYSKKAEGVMDQLGIADSVVDLRQLNTGETIARIVALLKRRAELHQKLMQSVPMVKSRVERFFTETLRPAIQQVLERN